MLRHSRTRNKFRRLFTSLETREATDLTHGTRFIASNPKWRKGRPLSAIADLQTKETPIDCSAGNIPRLQPRNDASVSKRRPHSTAERFYFIRLKGVKYRRQGPIYLHTDARVSGNPLHLPPRRSPFYPVWFQRVGKIPNWEPGLHCEPGDRFLTDSVWFGVEWQTWEARSCSLLVVDVVISPLFTPSISWKRRLIILRTK